MEDRDGFDRGTMMSPNRHITRAIARHLHLRVRHALPIARNSSTRKANRSGMTEHVHQKAQLIVRDTALALRTVAVAQTSQTTGPSIGRGITVVGSAGNGDSSGTRPRKGTEFRRIVPPVRAQPLIAPLRNTHGVKR